MIKLLTEALIVAGVFYAIAMLVFSLEHYFTTGDLDGGAFIAVAGVISGVVIAVVNEKA